MGWSIDPERQAQMLAGRLQKTFRHLRPRFQRRNVGAFRLYDRDIPEIRLAIDWYEGHLVVAEYERQQHASIDGWAERMARGAAAALGVPEGHLHLKQRRTRPASGARYGRLANTGQRLVVREGPLKFWVNLDDYLDTGLFLDHRTTRELVRQECSGKDVLNLYAYTGAFTCAAAQGGARRSVTVDRSRSYLDWTRDNLVLNGLHGEAHSLVASDSGSFLKRAAVAGERFDRIVLDPPSFSTPGDDAPLDVQRDHPELVTAALELLRPGGVLWFSTNHQRFEPRLEGVPASEIRELTRRTVPEDFRNRTAHRCFRLVR
ncbi:MAG TPA: class I SAM-dependent methyltransferase [Polyangiaceae bacterium]|nr:class I SAM-dependent methyltransferase [Polyangiaceae bacterium]